MPRLGRFVLLALTGSVAAGFSPSTMTYVIVSGAGQRRG